MMMVSPNLDVLQPEVSGPSGTFDASHQMPSQLAPTMTAVGPQQRLVVTRRPIMVKWAAGATPRGRGGAGRQQAVGPVVDGQNTSFAESAHGIDALMVWNEKTVG
jgi:hypothetical protein